MEGHGKVGASVPMSGHQVGTGSQTDEGNEGPEKYPSEKQQVSVFGFRGLFGQEMRPKASFHLERNQ